MGKTKLIVNYKDLNKVCELLDCAEVQYDVDAEGSILISYYDADTAVSLLEDIVYKRQDSTLETFTFNVTMDIKIKTSDLSEAIRLFHEKYPNIKEYQVNHISDEDERMGYELSKETGNRIYFKPGCLCGQPDCILDPMRHVAENCAHQSDMTSDKWVCCDYPKPEDDYCDYYDDEDK